MKRKAEVAARFTWRIEDVVFITRANPNTERRPLDSAFSAAQLAEAKTRPAATNGKDDMVVASRAKRGDRR